MIVNQELLLVPFFRPGHSAAGRPVLSKRFVQAINCYAEHWPGKINVLCRASAAVLNCLDPVDYQPDRHSFGLELVEYTAADLVSRLQQAAVILVTLDSVNLPLAASARVAGVPLVWISECSVRTRAQMIGATVISPLRRAKQLLGNRWRERRYVKALTQAVGVQCNGMPTYHDYRGLNANPLLFFDSRVTQDIVVEESTLKAKAVRLAEGAPLRLAFSGRLTEIKGVQHLPKVAAALRRQGIPFTLDVYGDGNLKDWLLTEIAGLGLGDLVQLRGVLDFHSELMPTFRQQVDAFLCCHPQGDPSCTYLETLACGVPIIGYANEAWRGMHELSGAGWLVNMGNNSQMADAVAGLHQNRAAWLSAAQAARQFAVQHTFETTIRHRVEHLCLCAKIDSRVGMDKAGEIHV